MNLQQFKRLIKKQQLGKLSDTEKELFNTFENGLLSRNKENVFSNEAHRQQIKKGLLKNINQTKKLKKNYTWLSIAASISILISIGIGYYFNSVSKTTTGVPAIAYVIKETTWGQKLNITLPDGSTVKLNSGSKIIFPKMFSDSIREITLEGEAFFDVVKNDEKPFIITSNKLITTVLGTTFNVDAYPDKTDIKVTLATGKVSVNAEGKKVLLTPSEQAVFNKENVQITTQKVDIQKYLEWKDGILRFENTTLGEAVKKLEKWYNVTIEFDSKNLSKCRFTGTFKNERLQTILESLIYVKQNIKYDFVSERKIILKGRCTN